MGLGDIESKETVLAAVAALQPVGENLVEKLRLAGLSVVEDSGNDLIDKAERAISLVAMNVAGEIKAAIAAGVADVETAIAGLDGWTVTIAIAPITITLKKPKTPV